MHRVRGPCPRDGERARDGEKKKKGDEGALVRQGREIPHRF